MDQKGISRIKILLVLGLCAILLLTNIILVRNYQARNRDAIRLADMAVLQSSLNQLYAKQASYIVGTGCTFGSVMLQPDCNTLLREYINVPEIFADPSGSQLICDSAICGQEACQYTVGEDFTESTYKIFFTLEKGIEGFAPGCHYLDQEGLH